MTMLVLASSMAPPTSMISVATSIPGISSGALRD
jgi:hypothetical protein